MPPAPLTTLSLILLTALSAWAWVLELRSGRKPSEAPTSDANTVSTPAAKPRLLTSEFLLRLTAIGSGMVLLIRSLLHPTWHPLQAHVDGLVMLAALFSGTILYLQSRQRLAGIAIFGLPLLTLLFAWAICASWWTFQPFAISSVWNTVHLASVYSGTLCSAVAAIAGGAFLYLQTRLRHKASPVTLRPFGSLERLESLIVTAATLGFGLLSLGLIAGLIIVTANDGATRLGPGWWHSPKVVLSVVAWLLYALVLNVRHGTRFRGARAAWLSIAGLLLLLTTLAIVTAMHSREQTQEVTAPATQSSQGIDSHALPIALGVPANGGLP